MKNLNKIIRALLMLTMVFAVSCSDSFLEVNPTGSITETQLASQKGLEGMLIGAYSMLQGRGGFGGDGFYAGSSNWLWGSILGGDANKGTNSGDQSQVNEIQAFSPQPTNGSVQLKYQATYEGIARVNALFRVLPNADPTVSNDVKLRIEAEAKFLRAHFYFELKKIFGDTPYVDETVDYGAGINDIGNNVDLWPKIEADLQFAVDNLPETQSSVGRANSWAAKAYLAKAYLFQQKYAAAKPLFDDVIANGKTVSGAKYDLVPHYGDLWRIATDDNVEVVFAIQSSAGTGSINNANPDFVLNFPYNGGPAGCCGFFQPSFELSNSFRTQGGLPLLDGSYNTGANQLVTDQGVGATDAFTPDAGPVDPRLDHSVGRRGIPYLDHGLHPGVAWIRDQNYGGPYAPKKFIWSKAEEATGVDKSSWTPGYSALNVPIIRFADVLLMSAEVEVELNNLEAARALVNRVRTRAADPTGFVMNGAVPAANYVINTYDATWTDQALARDAVRFERKLELSGEGHRFFDLVRWGIAATTLNDYLDYEESKVSASPFTGANFTSPKNEHLPIPQREIDILGSDVLIQNPGYN
ncbi:MAG TPA: RagB/SusD family nutrient uptake outer membrane protein [Cyclobacteriaceae bacterium]|nr:RagB/SusD family nutrient uptake outer membrane protein [Cyclobacteriaceae bacterium]